MKNSFLERARTEYDQLVEERDAKMKELEDFDELLKSEERAATPDEEETTSAILDEVRGFNERLTAKQELIEELEEIQAQRLATPPSTRTLAKRVAADPYDIELRTAPRTAQTRRDVEDRARKAVDDESRLTQNQKERLHEMLADRGTNVHGALARHVIATGRPAYRSAFAKLVRMQGAPYLTREEQAAVDEVRAINITTDGDGGFLMPFTLDPTVVLVNDGRTNPMRQLATVRTVMTDNWQGVNTAGVTASWDAESEEVSDDSPAFTQPSVDIHNIKAFIPFTVEAEDDFDGLAQDAAMMFLDAVDELEATAFATGSGTGEPFGIVTALVTAGSTVASATADVYAREDLYAVSDALPDRYDPRGVWLMHRAIISLTRELGVDDDPVRHIEVGAPPQLLERPLHKYSALDGTIDATEDNYIAVVGDIQATYRIHDRIGLTVERIPMLFGAGGRPTGERGWFARKRVGGNVVNASAALLLNIT